MRSLHSYRCQSSLRRTVGHNAPQKTQSQMSLFLDIVDEPVDYNLFILIKIIQ